MKEHINKFAKIGLRTLVLSEKKISDSQYQAFKVEYEEAKNNLQEKEKLMS